MSEGYVYAIHQDKIGFIWIGTHGGLNRYDGYGFKTFQYKPFDSATLGDNSVFFLKEDTTTGKFWIGGSSCLNEFDPFTFINKRYRYTSDQLEFADGIFINRHEILLGCQNRVLLFDTENKKFFAVPTFDESNRPVALTRVENTVKDSKGNFMVMSKAGIFFYDTATRTCRRSTPTSPDFSPFYGYEVFNVLQDRNGYYWIATNKKGLIRFDPVARKTTTLQPPAPLKNESLRFDVVIEDSQGSIWAGSSNGLFKINPVTMSSEYFSHDSKQAVSLSHPEINVIKEDRNHFMWIGTVGGGINKMIPQNAGFKNLVLSERKNAGNTGTYIMAMQQSGNNVWFVNIWDQLGKADIQTGKITLLTKPVLPSSYSWYSEGSIMKNQFGNPVILNGENSYEVIDKSPQKIEVLTRPSPGLFYIHYSKKGKLHYLVKAAVEKPFFRNDTLYGNQFFYDAEEDDAGNIWIGSSKGLIRLNTVNNEVVQYLHNDRDANSVSSDFIYALEIDSTYQAIWMAAYSGGLCSFHIPTGKFRHYNKEDGLADNIVYSIEKDLHGNLWFSTNAGISTYQIEEGIFRNYGKSDGLLNNEFNRQSSYRNEQGWIFFGGIFGIDYFHPDSILKTKSTPLLAFTNFRVFNKEYRNGNADTATVIELNHSDRYISIEFAALDYKDQQKIQYAYRLSGDSEWIKLGNQHLLSFSDLSTGNHLLQVHSTNAEGIWLNNEISCTINIRPPWWQNWWFRLFLILLLIGFIVLIIRGYFRRKLQKQTIVLEKKQAVEKERTRIATDIHDDLGSGLSRIRYLGETIRLKTNQQQEILQDIEKISEFSDEMVDKMNEIVWALNEKNDTLAALLYYIRSFTVEYLNSNKIHCKVSIPETMPVKIINGETRRNIFLAVKEVLHNMVKHAQATEALLEVVLDNNITILIRDNGCGIQWDRVRPFSNGISNIKKRMNDVRGNVLFHSNGGTEVVLKIPNY